jgi:hypothetical protein
VRLPSCGHVVEEETPATSGSREFIAELAREAQLAQLQAIDGLDTKSANLIGFVGVVLGLAFTAEIAADAWNVGLAVGAALLAVAAILLGVGLLPRGYKFNPNIAALREALLDAPPEKTAVLVIDSIVSALTWNTDLLRWKVRFVSYGVFLAVLGVVVLGATLLYAVIDRR